jgi:hypothetical protein
MFLEFEDNDRHLYQQHLNALKSAFEG